MSTPSRLRLAMLCVLLMSAAIVAVALPATALAARPGTEGWYWPTGSESFGSWSGWLQYRSYNSSWHLAQDMPAPQGSPVYAVGDGLVLESRYVRGFGPGGSAGGAVVILHTTATGAQFKALYGHLESLRYYAGQHVAAGSVIGYVNGTSPNHVHFGIHPGRAYPPDGNAFRGHTYIRSNLYGWTNAVAFLRNNARLVVCNVPPLPVVASVPTTGAPRGLSAVAGKVYWQITNAHGLAEKWVYVISEKASYPRLATAMTPVGDADRYALGVSLQPKPHIDVKDRKTYTGLAVSTRTPRRGVPILAGGAVWNVACKPLAGVPVYLDAYYSKAWHQVATVSTGSNGGWVVSYVPPMGVYLRARYVGVPPYASSRSSTLAVLPR